MPGVKVRRRGRTDVWEVIEFLNTLVDELDPDVSAVPWCHHSVPLTDITDQPLSNRVFAK